MMMRGVRAARHTLHTWLLCHWVVQPTFPNADLTRVSRATRRAAVAELCGKEDEARSDDGLVYGCLVRHRSTLAYRHAGCAVQLLRAQREAMAVWRRGAPLSAVCDRDVEATGCGGGAAAEAAGGGGGGVRSDEARSAGGVEARGREEGERAEVAGEGQLEPTAVLRCLQQVRNWERGSCVVVERLTVVIIWRVHTGASEGKHAAGSRSLVGREPRGPWSFSSHAGRRQHMDIVGVLHGCTVWQAADGQFALTRDRAALLHRNESWLWVTRKAVLPPCGPSRSSHTIPPNYPIPPHPCFS